MDNSSINAQACTAGQLKLCRALQGFDLPPVDRSKAHGPASVNVTART